MTDTADPLELLLDVADAACEGRPAPVEAGERFCRAVDAWIAGKFGSLDAALGLTPAPGQRSAATKLRQAERAAAVVDAAQHVQASSARELASRLAGHLSPPADRLPGADRHRKAKPAACGARNGRQSRTEVPRGAAFRFFPEREANAGTRLPGNVRIPQFIFRTLLYF
jgi:hypothetical protein